MIVGFISGPVKYYRNDGALKFVEAGTLKSEGKTIEASDGGPCIVDWDGDGMLDLLLGDGEGGVAFHKGIKKGSLDLAKAEAILAPLEGEKAWEPREPDPNSPVGFSPAKPGVRTKPWATDWNGDGKLDLLVGDYISVAEKAPILTEEQKDLVQRVKKRQMAVSNRLGTIYQRLSAEAQKKSGVDIRKRPTQAQMEKYSKVYMELYTKDKEYKKLNDEYTALYTRIAELEPRGEGTGFVWVYLRK